MYSNVESEYLEPEKDIPQSYNYFLEKINTNNELKSYLSEFSLSDYKKFIDDWFVLFYTGIMDDNKIDEMHEFICMVYFFKDKRFTHSKQLSNFIIKNNLKGLFPSLVGKLQMQKPNGEIFIYLAAVHPEYYSKLCEVLGLQGQQSKNTPKNFTPYKNIGY